VLAKQGGPHFLKLFFNLHGYHLLSREELRKEKLSARRRGKEEQAPARAGSAKDTVQSVWAKGEAAVPVQADRWTSLPNPIAFQGQSLSFDIRMRHEEVEIEPLASVPAPPRRRRRPKKQPKSIAIIPDEPESSTETKEDKEITIEINATQGAPAK